MDKSQVLQACFDSNNSSSPHAKLLQKILLCVHKGWFRINGQAPDKQFTLSDYVFDDENIMLDFRLLSESSKEKLLQWIIGEHEHEARMALLNDSGTSEYRGYSAETGIRFWRRLANVFYYQIKSYHWTLSSLKLSMDYQLLGLEICPAEKGMLICFNQLGTERSLKKYHQPDDPQEYPLLNVKRVHLTDEMVKRLLEVNLEEQAYQTILESPHPFSIDVKDEPKRLKEMREHRLTEYFYRAPSWWVQLWVRVKDWMYFKPPMIEDKRTLVVTNIPEVVEPETDVCEEKRPVLCDDHLIHEAIDKVAVTHSENKNTSVSDKQTEITVPKTGGFKEIISVPCGNLSIHEATGEVMITERRPAIQKIVNVGGGARGFALLGVLKALEDANLRPKQFAGSSIGAIVSTFEYLGYSADEIFQFLSHFGKDNLVHYEIDRKGISSSDALKGAIDYLIVKKVNAIIARFSIDKTKEGRRFLMDEVFNNNTITFASLKALKERYPQCELGESLLITATNMDTGKTRYFSHEESPDAEVSTACAMSASLPLVFKSSEYEGQRYTDGGVTNNVPIETFKHHNTTLLVPDEDVDADMLVCQFDAGDESDLLYKKIKQVYQENFIVNWIYSLITGVIDTANSWVKDRLKIRQLGSQVVLIPVDAIASTQLNVKPHDQQKLFNNGLEAGKAYIDARYECEQGKRAQNEEGMFQKFSSIEEALYYCCMRGHRHWFNLIKPEALKRGVNHDKITALEDEYFVPKPQPSPKRKKKRESMLFQEELLKLQSTQSTLANLHYYERLYPVLLNLHCCTIHNKEALTEYKRLKHHFLLKNAKKTTECIARLSSKTHVLFSMMQHMLGEDFQSSGKLLLERLRLILEDKSSPAHDHAFLNDAALSHHWVLEHRHLQQLLVYLEKKEVIEFKGYCLSLKEDSEPMVDVSPVKASFFCPKPVQEQEDEDDFCRRFPLPN